MFSRESTGLLICVLAGLAGLASATPADGQWLNYKTPGIPRTADGKPSLAAPTVVVKGWLAADSAKLKSRATTL